MNRFRIPSSPINSHSSCSMLPSPPTSSSCASSAPSELQPW
jgi:hypothetical protein